jgi:hypothetical protein
MSVLTHTVILFAGMPTKTGNVGVNLTPKSVGVTIIDVEKQ